MHLGHQVGTIECDLEEELQSADRGIERDRRGAAINQVQLVAPQILDRGRVRGGAEKTGEPDNCADLVGLRLGRELAHPHVVDHALAQCCDVLCRLSHGSAPVVNRGGLPRSTT